MPLPSTTVTVLPGLRAPQLVERPGDAVQVDVPGEHRRAGRPSSSAPHQAALLTPFGIGSTPSRPTPLRTSEARPPLASRTVFGPGGCGVDDVFGGGGAAGDVVVVDGAATGAGPACGSTVWVWPTGSGEPGTCCGWPNSVAPAATAIIVSPTTPLTAVPAAAFGFRYLDRPATGNPPAETGQRAPDARCLPMSLFSRARRPPATQQESDAAQRDHQEPPIPASAPGSISVTVAASATIGEPPAGILTGTVGLFGALASCNARVLPGSTEPQTLGGDEASKFSSYPLGAATSIRQMSCGVWRLSTVAVPSAPVVTTSGLPSAPLRACRPASRPRRPCPWR